MWSLALHVAVVAAVLVGIPWPERPRVPVATTRDPGHHRRHGRDRARAESARGSRAPRAPEAATRGTPAPRSRGGSSAKRSNAKSSASPPRSAPARRLSKRSASAWRPSRRSKSAAIARRERSARRTLRRNASGRPPRSARPSSAQPAAAGGVGAGATARARGRAERGARGRLVRSVRSRDREPDQGQMATPVERAARHRLRRCRRAVADGRRREREGRELQWRRRGAPLDRARGIGRVAAAEGANACAVRAQREGQVPA